MLYVSTVSQFSKMLGNLNQMLDLASQYAEQKKFNVEVLLNSRLAPDQFSFIKQVQIACDNAKGYAARMAGKEVPVHEDTEKTVADLKARIQKVVDYLVTFTPADFAGADERQISLSYWNGKSLSGYDYTVQYAIPNFIFHVATAYSILRNNGVDVGKRHFIGHLPFKN